MHLLHAGDRFNDAKFGLDKLRESTLNITSDYPKEFQPDAERLIEALYYAREKEIQYENGEIGMSDTIRILLFHADILQTPRLSSMFPCLLYGPSNPSEQPEARR